MSGLSETFLDDDATTTTMKKFFALPLWQLCFQQHNTYHIDKAKEREARQQTIEADP